MSDPSPRPICPVCGGDEVRGSKLALEREGNSPFPSRTLYEFYCRNCRTLEDMNPRMKRGSRSTPVWIRSSNGSLQ